MPHYHRARIPGARYFFTVVTFHRRRILTTPASLRALRESIVETRRYTAFTIDAWVVLPDHMHAIWTLPEDDCDYSRRWSLIKSGFVRRCGLPHRSQNGKDAGIWQRRFWEHVIRDERDWRAHMDYLHYNPVKHGWVRRVRDWPHSSFHRCVRLGWYDRDWGSVEPSEPDSGGGE